MDAVKFLKEKNRMCKKVNDCFICSLGNEDGRCQIGSIVNQRLTEEQLVENVKKWAAEHPVKTRQSEFLKMFPNAKMRDGTIIINPCEINIINAESKMCEDSSDCNECRLNYWIEEIEECDTNS